MIDALSYIARTFSECEPALRKQRFRERIRDARRYRKAFQDISDYRARHGLPELPSVPSVP